MPRRAARRSPGTNRSSQLRQRPGMSLTPQAGLPMRFPLAAQRFGTADGAGNAWLSPPRHAIQLVQGARPTARPPPPARAAALPCSRRPAWQSGQIAFLTLPVPLRGPCGPKRRSTARGRSIARYRDAPSRGGNDDPRSGGTSRDDPDDRPRDGHRPQDRGQADPQGDTGRKGTGSETGC